jgi:hypothetical protein
VAVLIVLVIIFGATASITIPFVSLAVAWNIIAVYVLLGALATLGRLVPVKTFLDFPVSTMPNPKPADA